MDDYVKFKISRALMTLACGNAKNLLVKQGVFPLTRLYGFISLQLRLLWFAAESYHILTPPTECECGRRQIIMIRRLLTGVFL